MFSKLRDVVLVIMAFCLIGVFFVYEFDLKDAVVDGIMGRNGTDDDNVPVASRSAAVGRPALGRRVARALSLSVDCAIARFARAALEHARLQRRSCVRAECTPLMRT